MKYFRLLVFSITLIIVETIVLVIPATVISSILQPLIYTHYDPPQLVLWEFIAGGGAMIVYFIFYRFLIELGPFLLLMFAFSFSPGMRIRERLVISKVIASIPCILVIVNFSMGIRAPVDQFMISAILWFPALAVSYYLFKKWYIKGINWVKLN